MKKIIFIFIALLSPLLWGQDFSFDLPAEDSFESSDFGSDSFQDSGDGSFFSEDSGGLEISGSLDIPITLTPQWNSIEDSTWSFSPEIITNLDYSIGNADLKVILGAKIDQDETELNIKESWVRLYMGKMDLEAGLMKIIWGKGDKVHVMDVLNPMDYSQFIEPDYNERKQADLMVRLNMTVGDTGRTELVFLPWFTPDTHALEGPWLMADAAALQTQGEAALKAFSVAYYTAALAVSGVDEGLAALNTAQKLAKLESTFLREDNTKTLEYAQGGIRFTHTAGPLDWGVAVIRSFVREPVIKGIVTAATDPHIEISYTPMVMAAQEAALVFKGFNLREEAALTLTRDWDGDDPYLKNSKVEWLFGFDRNAGLNNINLNVQAKGSYLLFTENMTASDPEHSNRYYNHMIIGSLSDSYLHESLKTTLSGIWNVEDKDYLLIPKIELTFREAVTFTAEYHLYEGDSDTVFGQFDKQDNLTLSCRMNF